MSAKPEQRKRWFSTGFTGGGLTSMDEKTSALHGAVIVREGEALGHGMWIDAEFVKSVAIAGINLKTKGLKARFGHPNMCSDALGTYIGRWKNFGVANHKDDVTECRADLFLSNVAEDAPTGDLKKYILGMAKENPDMCGASIVFDRDYEAELNFEEANTGADKIFKSPDAGNVKNLPHARLCALHAADMVDSPAATDGMFSGGRGIALAAQITDWLDLHPEVFAALREEGVIEILAAHAAELEPFMERYQAHKQKEKEIAKMNEKKPTEKMAVPEKPDNVEDPKGLCPHCDAGITQVDGDTATCPNGHKVPASAMKPVKKGVPANPNGGQSPAGPGEKAEVPEKPEGGVSPLADPDYKSMLAEANKKIEALTKGALPVSAGAAPATEKQKTSWQKAQKSNSVKA